MRGGDQWYGIFQITGVIMKCSDISGRGKAINHDQDEELPP
jgi:hypothetical protein